MSSYHIGNQIECNDSCCDIRRLGCELRDAVVTITAETQLTGGTGPSLINERGNGFFIKGHYIICPASVVLPLIDFWLTRNRVPGYPGLPSGSQYPNGIIRASNILVAVSNVNGCGKSYSYEAEIVGIDGAGNIAVLKINMNLPWNKCNPEIRSHHPYLKWGKSRNTCPGDKIILIGDITTPTTIQMTQILAGFPAENAIAIGNIADNRYVYPGGQIPGELLLLDNLLPSGFQSGGLPVITCDGKVVGMTVFLAASFACNIALSEFFMRRPIKALIRSYEEYCNVKQYNGFIDRVLDPIGDYLRFNKAWLGISGFLMTQEDFNTTLRNDNLLRDPLLVNGQLSNGPDCKEIVGFRVLAVAAPTGAATGYFIPGAVIPGSTIPPLNKSSVYGIISQGDIITHINGCPLGDRKGQVAPALVMWRVRPGDLITIQYRKQSDNFQICREITACTSSYEPFLDYPFYSIVLPGAPPQVRLFTPTLI